MIFSFKSNHPFTIIHEGKRGQLRPNGALSAGGCGQEELPHARGQGQKPEGPHAQRAAAKRSYPTSEVRGSSREYQTATAQERLREAAPRPRSGAEARRTPCPKGGGQEELPHVRGQGQWPRSLDCDGAGTAERSYPTSKVRGGCREQISHAISPRPGAAGGRSYPTPLSPRPRVAAGSSNPMTEARGGAQPSSHFRIYFL